jgi:hypothetical protein
MNFPPNVNVNFTFFCLLSQTNPSLLQLLLLDCFRGKENRQKIMKVNKKENVVKWNELVFFDALPVSTEPEYASGFTCDVCGVEFLNGPFYHNTKKGRDACLRCAVEAGVHYFPGSVCTLLLSAALTGDHGSSPVWPPSAGQRVLCALQFTTVSFAVIFVDGSAVTLLGSKDATAAGHGFTHAVWANGPPPKRSRDGRLSRLLLADSARLAAVCSFAEALRRFPALKPFSSGPPAMAPAAKLFPVAVELCSPLDAGGSATTSASLSPPVVLWHNLVPLHKADAAIDSVKSESSLHVDAEFTVDSAGSYSSNSLLVMIVSRTLHAWHPATGIEILADFSAHFGTSAVMARKNLEANVRGVFRFGYAVPKWKEMLNAPSLAENEDGVGVLIWKVLDGISLILPWS